MLPYFLNEGLCVPVQEMDDVRRCSLWVRTLRHSPHLCDCSENSDIELSPGCKAASFPELKEVFQDESVCCLSPAKKAKMESLHAAESSVHRRMPFADALRQHEAWILDIDLDFFSTSNPFKRNFTEVVWSTVQKTTCSRQNVQLLSCFCALWLQACIWSVVCM